MLYQEIRPYRFDDMVGQNYIVENVRAQAKRDAWFHSFILAGQFGSGKTTMARIIAMAANCRHKDEHGNPCGECANCRSVLNGSAIDFKEIDGASNTGVDNIRDLKEYVSFHPVAFEKKVIIIDEVHKLSNAAFNSLLKVLEEPPEYAIFILCTTEVEAIPETVQSRCAIYRFGAIPEPMIADHLMSIAESEHLSLDEDAALLIAKYSSGAMRNAIKYLEQLSASSDRITAEFVSTILGVADTGVLFDLLTIYLEQQVNAIPAYVETLQSSGRDMTSFMKEVERACADLILCKEGDPALLVGTESYKERALEVAESYSTSSICQLSSELLTVSEAMRTDGTATSFLLQSVALIQRIRREVLEKEKLLRDLNMLNNEIAGLKSQIVQLKKNGLTEVRQTTEEAVTEEAGETVEVPREEQKAPESICKKESVSEALPLEEGFVSCGESEVPFDETSGKPTATVYEEDNDWDLEEDIDLDDDSLFDEPVTTARPIRTLPAAPTKRDLSADTSGYHEYNPKSEPIPRKSSAAAPAGKPNGTSFSPSSGSATVSRVDEVREKLLAAVDENQEIYKYIADECVFDEINGHVRARISPFWKAAALMRFLQMHDMANLLEVESRA